MKLNELKTDLQNCKCGKEHTFDLETLEVYSGAIQDTAKILNRGGFPKKILAVFDENSYRVTDGVLDILKSGGFIVESKVYPSKRTADMEDVEEIQALIGDNEGVLSVGTGSINDICRLASFYENRPLAIFATAPSMDGFASDSAPITKNDFKISYLCRQPKIIIADTAILAKAPLELKAAGFGDMIAKCIAVADWRIATLTHGDYYCEKIADLVRKAFNGIVNLAPKVREESEEAAGAIMENLVLTGVAMQLAKCTRPASGTEHIISHFWECKKLARGKISDFHGKKVGVATLIVADIYHKLCKIDKVKASKEVVDFDELTSAYGEQLMPEVVNYNTPDTIANEVDLDLLEQKWEEIKRIIVEEIPPVEELKRLYALAGAVTSGKDIEVDDELFDLGIKYHPYMRKRITLMRLLPLLNIDPLEVYKSE